MTPKKGDNTMRNQQLRSLRSLASTFAGAAAVVGVAAGIATALTGCSSGTNGSLSGGDDPNGNSSTGTNGDNGGSTTGATSDGGGATTGGGGTTTTVAVDAAPPAPVYYDTRTVDYGAALRTATLKLVGDLPTVADMKAVTDEASYEAQIDKLLADARFAPRMIQWWRDTLKTGQPGVTPTTGMPSYDTAATFAAEVTVNSRPFTDLFTAATNTCPTFASGTFTDASCVTANGGPTAGLLTDPGIMSNYYSNLSFRRARFIQETFVCTHFPAEFGPSTPMGAGSYTSPWDFNSIAGADSEPTAYRVNFQDTTSIICANCHTTMNHFAPLFGFFDANGKYNTTYQVHTPILDNPISVLTDWLPAGGQTYAWRNGKPVADIPTLGAAIAADPDVAACAVNRIWNWGFSRGDIVNDVATIPPAVTASFVTDFTANGYNLKRVIRNVFTSPDFVKF